MKPSEARKMSWPLALAITLVIIAMFCGAAWWLYQENQKEQQRLARESIEAHISVLQVEGRTAVTARKWEIADEAYQQIQQLDPGSPIASAGFDAIRKGKAEEKNQQLFYTLGQSQAALEAGRWDEAETLAKSVLEQASDNKNALQSAKNKLEIIRNSRFKHEVSLIINELSDALDNGNIQQARTAHAALQKKDPQNPNLTTFTERIEAQLRVIKLRHDKAEELYQKAKALDTGQFSAEAVAMLEEARRLHPESAVIQALHKKMSNYARAIHVPADYPSISKALDAARPRDIIRVAPGTYQEAVSISKPVRLEGSADGQTIIELPAKEDALISVSKDAPGTVISGFELKHAGFDHDTNRFSALSVYARDVTIASCNIEHAAGHGIAVLEGGSAKITGCKITLCGWDGISVFGQGSHAKITDCLSQGNLQHGVGFWLGGSGSVTGSRLLKNGLCGVVAMSEGAKISLSSNICSGNRDAGILVSNAGEATIHANTCEKNLLSGIVVRGQGTKAELTGNIAKGNKQCGILTQLGTQIGAFENNRASGNSRRQIWRNASMGMGGKGDRK